MVARALRAHLELAALAYGRDLPMTGAVLQPPARTAEPTPMVEPMLEPDREPTAAGPAAAKAAVQAPLEVAGDAGDADPADRLATLAADVAQCTRCKLASGRTNTVFGEGSPRARVMFVGEAPGFHEDRQGRPFVGPAGQLLDRILQNAMGLRREEVFIANVNKCRPPENRDPHPDEVAACLPYLRAQVRAIRPEVIVALGRIAAQNLLSTSSSMTRLRGQDLRYEGIPVIATWHPAYLLRNPAAKRDTWDDIKRVNRLLGLPEVPRPSGAADR